MSFLESIQLKDGQLKHLTYHQNRINQTVKAANMSALTWNLASLLKDQELPTQGLYKVRLIYNQDQVNLNWQSYQIRQVHTLKVVYTQNFNYPLKSTNRIALDQLFAQKEQADDIIICRDGWITDSYYANLALFKNDCWYTPQSPLLKGTKRQFLLDQKRLIEVPVSLASLDQYEKVALINAMIDLEDLIWIPMKDILF